MGKRRPDDWMEDELWPRIKSRATFGATFFWLAIWGICGFNPWVGFGLFFAWGGSVGLFSKGKDRDEDFDDDDWSEDRRGYNRTRGGETPEAAKARQDGEAEPDPAQPKLHRQVIESAADARARLEAAASVAEGELGARLRNMVAKVNDVEKGLNGDPSRLSDVQRLFVYYLPATADLLAARGALSGSGDPARLAEIDTMIGKLDLAYTDFAERIVGHDTRNLALDLRLLDQALDEEFTTKTRG